MEEVEAFAALAGVEGLGATRIRHLVGHFGSACAVLASDVEEIIAICGCAGLRASWRDLIKGERWRQDLDIMRRAGVELVPYTSMKYPKALLEVADHPALLYVKGQLTPSDKRSIAVVGTRGASVYGMEMAEKISRELVGRGFTIVSGLARGVDTAAHRGALDSKGRTIAVIGSGLANIYPPENRKLAGDVATYGALVSEFPMTTPPDRLNFPQRNRIVSGMTLGTVLVEAPLKSGAMITMDRAFMQGRKLFALPGRADVEGFRGNHSLIKSGKAVLVEDAEDIARHFDDFFGLIAPQHVEHQHFFLDDQEQRLLNIMPTEEIGVDSLVLLTNLPVHQVHTTLMGLILKKAVKEFPGKIYKKIAARNSGKRHN